MLELVREQLVSKLESFVRLFCSSENNRDIVFIALYCNVYHGVFDICIDNGTNMNDQVLQHRISLSEKRRKILSTQSGRGGVKYYLVNYRNRFLAHTQFCADFQFPFQELFQFSECEHFFRGNQDNLPPNEIEEHSLHFCWLVLDDLSRSDSIKLVNFSSILRLGFEFHDDDLGLVVTHELSNARE